MSLNPLHCGAVVASRNLLVGGRGQLVSIPFIAGQWSLHIVKRVTERELVNVSIPFIAGQWSLLAGEVARWFRHGSSQSPSLRGSGRFKKMESLFVIAAAASLNPLHCGAVVASAVRLSLAWGVRVSSQSPSLRGSGRFSRGAREA